MAFAISCFVDMIKLSFIDKKRLVAVWRRFIAFYRTTLGQWVCSAVFAALGIGLIHILRPVFFGTNDDLGIMNTFQGSYFKEPNAFNKYTSVIIGAVVSSFYKAMPSVPWYPIHCILVIWASVTVFFRCTTRLCQWRGLPGYIAPAVNLFMFILLYTTPICSMQFTYIGAMIGAAAVALILPAAMCGGVKSRVADISLSTLMFLYSTLVRYALRDSIICFWGMAVVVAAVVVFRRDRKRLLIGLLCSAVLVVSAVGCASALHSLSVNRLEQTESEEYIEFNKYRVQYMDLVTVTYDMAPELYESLGWSEELYQLTKSWYFWDPAFNAENLRAICEYGGEPAASADLSTAASGADAAATGTDAVSDANAVSGADTVSDTDAASTNSGEKTLSYYLYIARITLETLFSSTTVHYLFATIFIGLVFVVFSIWRLLRKRDHAKYGWFILLGAASAAMFMAQAFYLMLLGRLIFRGYFAPLLCAVLLLSECALLIAPGKLALRESLRYRAKKIALNAAICAALLACSMHCVFALSYLLDSSSYEHIQIYNNAKTVCQDYATENYPNIYVRDPTLVQDSRTYTNPTQRYFMPFWGGAGFKSSSSVQAMERMGKTELSYATFLDDDVFFVTRDEAYSDFRSTVFGKYMIDRCGESIDFQLVDELEYGVRVYKITSADQPVSGSDAG